MYTSLDSVGTVDTSKIYVCVPTNIFITEPIPRLAQKVERSTPSPSTLWYDNVVAEAQSLLLFVVAWPVAKLAGATLTYSYKNEFPPNGVDTFSN